MQFSRLAAAVFLFLQLAAAVNVIYDETRWTKEHWNKYKVEFEPLRDFTPSEEVPSDPALKTALSGSKLNSLDGPSERRLVSRPSGLWYHGKESAAEAFDDTDAIDHAAHAVQCTTCHALIDAAWKTLVKAIHEHDVVNEDSIRDVLDSACDAQVVEAVLDQYTVYKVDHESGGEAGDLGQLSSLLGGQLHSMMMFVVRERKQGARRTMAEESAVSKACMDLMSNHGDAIAKTLMAKAKDYYATFLQVQLKHAALAKPSQSPSASSAGDDGGDDDEDDDYADPDDDDDDDDDDDAEDDDSNAVIDAITKALTARQKERARQEAKQAQGLAYKDKLVSQLGCVDVELLCSFWASIGECNNNPMYMRGAKGRAGHCELSCGQCKPDDSWQVHPLAKAELELAAHNAAQSARQLACAASKACLTGVSGTSAGTGMVQVAALEPPTPGALLAKVPGFVLGKPFWATPSVRDARVDASNRTTADERDAVGAVLHGELGNKVLSIPGMDGFFTYELVYRQSVYHYHEEDDGRITEHWVLGAYDHAATLAKRAADATAAADSGSEAVQLWQEQRRLAPVAAVNAAGAAGTTAAEAGTAAAAEPKGAADTAAPTATAASGAAGAADAPEAARQPVAAAARDGSEQQMPSSPPPPFLEVLDLVPDVAGMQERYWPYYVQLYTGGQTCTLAGGVERERRAEVRFACSPDGGQHMLVREPAFCSYVVVVYSPALCGVGDYKPVQRPKRGNTAVARKAADGKLRGGSSGASSGGSRGGSSPGAVVGGQVAGGARVPADSMENRATEATRAAVDAGSSGGSSSGDRGGSGVSSSKKRRRRDEEGSGSPQQPPS